MADILTAAESAQRIAQLREQGWIVTTETQPDGSVVVYKRRAGASSGAWVLCVVGLLGCWAFSQR